MNVSPRYGTCPDIASVVINEKSEVSNATLRQKIRTRLASGSLFPVDGKVVAGKATGKLCTLCAMPISKGEIEHEVVGPTTVWAHWDCYSIWRQESEALKPPEPASPSVKTTLPLHVDRLDHDGAGPATAEYAVSMGGAKDGVGTVLLGKPKGLDALVVLLRSLGIAHTEIVTACQMLTEQSHYAIQGVTLTPAVLRRFRL